MPPIAYRFFADVVVAFHFAFILFVVAGGFLVARRPALMKLHLGCAAWGAGIELLGGICPLTPFEKWLRHLAGLGGYHGSFIDRYILPIVYPRGMTRTTQIVLGLIVIAINLFVYLRYKPWQRVRPSGG